MEKLAAIVGPTGVGKSRIAVKVAERLNAEIISCDSMQIYRGMDIGTAKILPQKTGGIPHHLIDVVDPDAVFSVSDYKKLAQKLIAGINDRGRIPLLVGGTGLYYQVVVDDYQLEPIDTDDSIRTKLVGEAENHGNTPLYERLQSMDPEAAEKISANDRKRIIRALEVIEKTGRPFSLFQKKNKDRYHTALIGLTMPREVLYQLIEQRVDDMIREGFVEEVQELLKKGFDIHQNSMQALGYSHIARYLGGETALEEAIGELKRDTRRYAKRQLTWFKKDHRIKWLDLAEYNREDDVVEIICEYVSRTML